MVDACCSSTQLCLSLSSRGHGVSRVRDPLLRLTARGGRRTGRATQTQIPNCQRTREVSSKCDLPRIYDLSGDERVTMACLVPIDTGLTMTVFIPTGVVYKHFEQQPVMLVKADYDLENPYDGAQSAGNTLPEAILARVFCGRERERERLPGSASGEKI